MKNTKLDYNFQSTLRLSYKRLDVNLPYLKAMIKSISPRYCSNYTGDIDEPNSPELSYNLFD